MSSKTVLAPLPPRPLQVWTEFIWDGRTLFSLPPFLAPSPQPVPHSFPETLLPVSWFSLYDGAGRLVWVRSHEKEVKWEAGLKEGGPHWSQDEVSTRRIKSPARTSLYTVNAVLGDANRVSASCPAPTKGPPPFVLAQCGWGIHLCPREEGIPVLSPCKHSH